MATRMSRRDFSQKLEMRRAFWAMGASTRLEVKLGSLVPRAENRADRQDWTDLDVLAVHYSPLTGLTSIVADCKTTRGRVAERLFWLRGVMDLSGAKIGYLVRDDPLPAASRQLALRVGITAFDRADREALLGEVRTNGKQSPSFLEARAVEHWLSLLNSLPKDLERLARYRDTGYWISPRHRNVTFLPTILGTAREHLDPQAHWAFAVVVDMAWLYLLAALTALEEMSRLNLAEPRVGLAQVVIGDERERREKEFLAEQLRTVFAALPRRQPVPAVDVVPRYYGDLTELMIRLAKRRSHALVALRALELVSAHAAMGEVVPWPELGARSETTLGIKMASDVVRFLVRAANLSRTFQDRFDATTGNDVNDSESATEVAGANVAVPTGTGKSDRLVDQVGLFMERESTGRDGE